MCGLGDDGRRERLNVDGVWFWGQEQCPLVGDAVLDEVSFPPAWKGRGCERPEEVVAHLVVGNDVAGHVFCAVTSLGILGRSDRSFGTERSIEPEPVVVHSYGGCIQCVCISPRLALEKRVTKRKRIDRIEE